MEWLIRRVAKVTQEGLILTESQVVALEKVQANKEAYVEVNNCNSKTFQSGGSGYNGVLS